MNTSRLSPRLPGVVVLVAAVLLVVFYVPAKQAVHSLGLPSGLAADIVLGAVVVCAVAGFVAPRRGRLA